MSQLELGAEAEVSARHISFLETGRSRPSREMVLHLGQVLDMPRADRNLLLEAAGFVAAFRSRDLESEEMLAVRQAAEWMIERHQPYPALILDRHWRLVRVNGPAGAMLSAFGLGEGDSLLDALTGSNAPSPAAPRLGEAVDNWPELARHLLARLRTENARAGGDPVLEAAIERLAGDPAVDGVEPTGPLPPFVPTRYRIGGTMLAFLSTVAHFAGADDVALADLQIELLFPADDATRAILLGDALTT